MPPELDVQLQELSTAVERIGANLFDLEADPTCTLLDEATLRGVSAARWADARAARAELFEWLGRLTGLVNDAGSLRGRHREAARRELLCGPSIALGDGVTPLTDRALLGTSRVVERCSPAELLARMATTFDAVTQTIAEAREVYEVVVPRLRDMRTGLLALAEAAEDPDIVDVDPRSLQEEHRALAEEALEDPLSVDRARVERLGATVASASRQAVERRELRAHAADRIAGARARCGELHELAAESQELRRAVVARVRVPAAPDPGSFDPDIDARLQLVDRLAGRGDWRSAQRELETVEQRIAAALLEVRAGMSDMRSILEERSRLRGLLDAYMGKAAALRRLEDPGVARTYGAARDALYIAPSDLDAARTLIADFRRSIEVLGTVDAEVPR